MGITQCCKPADNTTTKSFVVPIDPKNDPNQLKKNPADKVDSYLFDDSPALPILNFPALSTLAMNNPLKQANKTEEIAKTDKTIQAIQDPKSQTLTDNENLVIDLHKKTHPDPSTFKSGSKRIFES